MKSVQVQKPSTKIGIKSMRAKIPLSEERTAELNSSLICFNIATVVFIVATLALIFIFKQYGAAFVTFVLTIVMIIGSDNAFDELISKYRHDDDDGGTPDPS